MRNRQKSNNKITVEKDSCFNQGKIFLRLMRGTDYFTFLKIL